MKFIPALILSLLFPILVHAAPALLPQAEVDAIISKFQTAYAQTFDRRDAQGMAALLTENATLQNEWGDVTQGRSEIEALVARLMSGLQPGTKLADTSLVAQSVAPNVIVSQGISHRLVPGAEPVQMFFTRVLVWDGREWKMAATQIARPSQVPKPGAPAK